jgi:cation diffusion facilitator family transporter
LIARKQSGALTMHSHSIDQWAHEHVFLGERHDANERRTWLVVWLTVAMMVAEIVAGSVFGSMALLADGWHMSTHATAIGIAAFAYRYARTHAHDPRFSFGTGKLGELAAFASALILAVVAVLIAYESAMRLFAPVAIHFGEAILIAFLGLAVNLVSAWLLFDHDDHAHAHHHHHAHHHDHGHDHHEDHHHSHGDTNLTAAYTHVLADALTSVLALIALFAGYLYGWTWPDPVIGIVGALVIARWSWTLIGTTAGVLADTVSSPALTETIRRRLEVGSDRVSDLHLWRLGPGHTGVIAAVVADDPQAPDTYKARLSGIPGLSHITVEVHCCPGPHSAVAA